MGISKTIFRSIIFFLAAAFLFCGNAYSNPLVAPTSNTTTIPEGYTGATVPQKTTPKQFQRKRRRRKRWGHFKSFKAEVTNGALDAHERTSRSVDFDKKTGTLQAKGWDPHVDHNMYIMTYSHRRGGELVVYGSRGARTTYYRNGKVKYYNARTGETSYDRLDKSVYQAKKQELIDKLVEAIEMVSTNGVMQYGDKGDFQEALMLVKE